MSTPNNLPSRLWHYTSAVGLLGTLQNREIWLTSVAYLNDSSEYTHGAKRLLDGLSKLASIFRDDPGKKRVVDRVSAILQDTVSEERAYGHYVYCLSELHDELTMWRGYGGGEGAFAVGFDLERLRSSLALHRTTVSRCFYEEDQQIELVHRRLVALESSLKATGTAFNDANEIVGEPQQRLHEMIAMSAFLKNHSFRAEAEWRCVKWMGPDEASVLRFRVSDTTLVPFVGLKLWESPADCPISEIVIGPARHGALNREAVRALLQREGLGDVSIRESTVPFRRL